MIWLELLQASAKRVVEEYISIVRRSACWAAEVMHRMLQFLSAGRRFDVHGVGLVQYHNLMLAGRQRDLHFTVRRRRQRAGAIRSSAGVQGCSGWC